MLHRKIAEHWLWKDKPFDRRSAWIDMLLMANHDDNKFLLGNELVEVEKGSFVTSELKLMERWGWSKAKVRSFLNLLQNDSMIVKKTDHKKTVIIIENYSEYQYQQTTEELQKDRRETTKRPQKDTNNNIYINNNNYINKSINDYSNNTNLKQTLKDFIDMRIKIKSPMTDKAFDMLLKELNKLASTDELKIQILEQSIINNWKSVYAIKPQNNAKAKQNNNKQSSLSELLEMIEGGAFDEQERDF